MRNVLILISAMLTLPLVAQQLADTDLNAPFGWACAISLTSVDDYYLSGGSKNENPKTITLISTGKDQRDEITEAIKNNDIIIFDGKAGDFVVSSLMEFREVDNRTILGINGARICTQYYVTPEIIKQLEAANVMNASTAGGGGKLSNGMFVREEREQKTRQVLIDYFKNPREPFRSAGLFSFRHCENLIIRNLRLVGPGPVDVGGSDLLSFYGVRHAWVDHCDFTDGLDGNFDITQGSDFITVSWCTFSYTERAYDHRNTNLVGSSDKNVSDEDRLNITYAWCHWGNKCNARMPMGRFGTIHMLNNYYSCAGNGSPCINPRINSEFRIEGNYFDRGVYKVFGQQGAKRWTWTSENVTVEPAQVKSSDTEPVVMPYKYLVAAPADVPELVRAHGGATLADPKQMGR